ncbi:hypothetical protein H4219_003557 [Mycoemilia scoparia]|uniref:Uncharacterized protein n=1 Tax=Mycoemilia scoparia TaxID=417184 RepID=A0A9W7ZUM6_9FUNG|nr:hypothetical protein H4219_003557 [Mycoemilia scoparia]
MDSANEAEWSEFIAGGVFGSIPQNMDGRLRSSSATTATSATNLSTSNISGHNTTFVGSGIAGSSNARRPSDTSIAGQGNINPMINISSNSNNSNSTRALLGPGGIGLGPHGNALGISEFEANLEDCAYQLFNCSESVEATRVDEIITRCMNLIHQIPIPNNGGGDDSGGGTDNWEMFQHILTIISRGCLKLLTYPNWSIRARIYKLLRRLPSLEILDPFKPYVEICIMRSLSQDIEQQAEREQALKFVRYSACSKYGNMATYAVIKVIIAITEHTDDALRNICLETLCELLVTNPDAVIKARGLRTLVNASLEGPWTLSVSIVSAFIYILDNPSSRKLLYHGLDLDPIAGALMETSTKYTSVNERAKVAAFLITQFMKSWSGLQYFISGKRRVIRSLIATLKLIESNRKIVLGILFEVFGLSGCLDSSQGGFGNSDDFEHSFLGEAQNSRGGATQSKLITSSRLYPIEYFRTIVLVVLMEEGLLKALLSVVESPDRDAAEATAILIKWLINNPHINLPPEYSTQLYSIQELVDRALRSSKMQHCVNAFHMISKIESTAGPCTDTRSGDKESRSSHVKSKFEWLNRQPRQHITVNSGGQRSNSNSDYPASIFGSGQVSSSSQKGISIQSPHSQSTSQDQTLSSNTHNILRSATKSGLSSGKSMSAGAVPKLNNIHIPGTTTIAPLASSHSSSSLDHTMSKNSSVHQTSPLSISTSNTNNLNINSFSGQPSSNRRGTGISLVPLNNEQISSLISKTLVTSEENSLAWNWDAILQLFGGNTSLTSNTFNIDTFFNADTSTSSGNSNNLINSSLPPKSYLEQLFKRRDFMNRIVEFYTPSSRQFSDLQRIPEYTKFVDIGCLLVKALLSITEGLLLLEQSKILLDIVNELSKMDTTADSLNNSQQQGATGNGNNLSPSMLSIERGSYSPSESSCFSNSRIQSTLSPGYFKFIAAVSHSKEGTTILERHRVFDVYYRLLEQSTHVHLTKYILTSMDYLARGHSQVILSRASMSPIDRIRESVPDVMKLLAIKYMKIENNQSASELADWAIERLLFLLYDTCKRVRQLAAVSLVSVLDEAEEIDILNKQRHPSRQYYDVLSSRGRCESSSSRNSTCRPPYQSQGIKQFDRVLKVFFSAEPLIDTVPDEDIRPLVLRLLATEQGFKFCDSHEVIGSEMEAWETTEGLSYIHRVELEISKALTVGPIFSANPDGTNAVASLETPCTPPHLFGELAKSSSGRELLIDSEIPTLLFETLDNIKWDSTDPTDILTLKATLWALGSVGSCEEGYLMIESNRAIPKLLEVAESSTVLSIKGTCLYTLGLLSRSQYAAEVFEEQGWTLCYNSDGGYEYAIPSKIEKILNAQDWAVDGILKTLEDTSLTGSSFDDLDIPTDLDSIQKDILKAVASLNNNFFTKSASRMIAKLRTSHPHYFKLLPLYRHALKIVSKYRYRLNTHRFIHDMFNVQLSTFLNELGASDGFLSSMYAQLQSSGYPNPGSGIGLNGDPNSATSSHFATSPSPYISGAALPTPLSAMSAPPSSYDPNMQQPFYEDESITSSIDYSTLKIIGRDDINAVNKMQPYNNVNGGFAQRERGHSSPPESRFPSQQPTM